MPAINTNSPSRIGKTRKTRSRYWILEPHNSQYTEEVKTNAFRLKKHIKSGYCRRSDEEKEVLLRDFWNSDGRFLAANNPAARIHFYRHWAYHGHQFTNGHDNYLVTLTPERY